MKYIAISGGEIIMEHENEAYLRQKVNQICETFPQLFYREYITVMTETEWEHEQNYEEE